MAKIILVHGMAANRESWFDIPTLLEAEGHSVHHETLPGHERDFGLNFWPPVFVAQYIAKVVEQFPTSGKVTLIGHSMGGHIISMVAAAYPERVERLIYVAAMMPTKGQNIAGIMLSAGISRDAMLAQIESYQEQYPEVFGSQPVGVFMESLGFDSAAKKTAYNNIPAYAVICKPDEVLPTKYQKDAADARGIPEARQFLLASDHIPQVTDPAGLMEVLKPLL